MSITFLEGNTLSVTKNLLVVEVTYQNDKPFSFLANVDFVDDEGNRYTIPISGTTDNSIFTAYPFILRHLEEVTYEANEDWAVQLVLNADSDSESVSIGKLGFGTKTSAASSVISNPKAFLGYTPIPTQALASQL
jgi:hypothetical protein